MPFLTIFKKCLKYACILFLICYNEIKPGLPNKKPGAAKSGEKDKKNMLKEITRNEANNFIKGCAEYSRQMSPTLKDVHNATSVNIETAKFYIIDGRFTYNQLYKEGITNAVIIAKPENKYSWYKALIWIENNTIPALIDDRWINIDGGYKKETLETTRKEENKKTLIISSADPLRINDWSVWYRKNRETKPADPKQALYNRLVAYKNDRDKNRLKNYNGFRNDIFTAKTLMNHLYKTIAGNMSKYSGAEMVKYCEVVNDVSWDISRLETGYKRIIQTAANTQPENWYKIETMAKYNSMLKTFENTYMSVCKKIEGWA